MRILSFCKMWDKLQQKEFTTFRFPRKDRAWSEGEKVQIYYKSRSPQRESIGRGVILFKEIKKIIDITEAEATADGFHNMLEMWVFLGKPDMYRDINKLTINLL